MDDLGPMIPAHRSRFLCQLRHSIRKAGFALETEKTYVHRIQRYIGFDGLRHRGTSAGGRRSPLALSD